MKLSSSRKVSGESSTSRSNLAPVSVVVVDKRELFYDAGPSDKHDRPAFVRAASGLDLLGGEFTIVQDDAQFLGVVRGFDGPVLVRALPRLEDGLRLHDEGRGTKHLKRDLECVTRIEGRLMALGSGSTERRRAVFFDPDWIDASALYRALSDHPAMKGAELNIEGVTVVLGRVLLFQRGNGLGARTLVFDLPLEGWLAFLRDPRPERVPPIEAIAFDLGTVAYHPEGSPTDAAHAVPLSFTDATSRGDTVYFLAAAEASPDAYRDGEVVGVRFGMFRYAEWEATLVPIALANGEECVAKLEGLALDEVDPRWAFAVVDADDPTQPSELWRLDLQALLSDGPSPHERQR